MTGTRTPTQPRMTNGQSNTNTTTYTASEHRALQIMAELGSQNAVRQLEEIAAGRANVVAEPPSSPNTEGDRIPCCKCDHRINPETEGFHNLERDDEAMNLCGACYTREWNSLKQQGWGVPE